MTTFDFESIRNRLIERLKEKEDWRDTLFFSTNARLLDIISEEFEYLMQTVEMYTLENKWSLAQQRSSLMTEASFFNYKPHRKQGASGNLKISTSPDFDLSYPITIPIPKYSVFKSEGGISFVSSRATNLVAGDIHTFIPVIQGDYKEITFISQGEENESFIVLNDSIDNSLYNVVVKGETWKEIESLYIAEKNEKVYEIKDLYDMSGIELSFGNNWSGKKLEEGDEIVFRFVETLGKEGNIDTENIITNVVSSFKDLNDLSVTLHCTNTFAISGGTNYESIEGIRYKAPKIYKAGDRAISKGDYEAIIESLNFVNKAVCWGETEVSLDNKDVPGTYIPAEENMVHLTVLTNGGKSINSDEEIEIRKVLDTRKSPTDILQFEPAILTGINFKSDVFVRDRQFDASTIHREITEKLFDTYNILNVSFNNYIRQSTYMTDIGSIEGVEYHNTIVQYITKATFDSAYVATFSTNIFNVAEGTVKVYIGERYLLAEDDGYNGFVGKNEFTVSSSSIIDYINGEITLIVEDGLTEDYNNYQIEVVFESKNINVEPIKRNQVIFYQESAIDVQYIED